MTGWPLQKEQLETHNLFYSAIKGEEGPGLVDKGYCLLGTNVEVPDRRNDVTVEPDFALYDGHTLTLCSVIAVQEIVEADVMRMKKYPQIGLEAIEKYLRRAPVEEKGLSPTSVKDYDYLAISPQSLIEDHEAGKLPQQPLDELKEICSIVTVKKGVQATLHHGLLHDRQITSFLNSGIPLPRHPPKTKYLTAEYHKESLAVGICHDFVIDNLEEGFSFEVNPYDIRNHFGDDIEIGKIKRVFEFLEHMDACRQVDENTYAFTKGRLDELLAVEPELQESTVEEILSESDTSQTALAEW